MVTGTSGSASAGRRRPALEGRSVRRLGRMRRQHPAADTQAVSSLQRRLGSKGQ